MWTPFFGEQGLVDGEELARLLRRQHFDGHAVGPDSDDAQACEEFGAFDSEAGFAGEIFAGRGVGLVEPAGVQENDVTLANGEVLLLHGAFDLGAVDGGAGVEDVFAEVARHVEQHASGNDGRDGVRPEFAQAGGGVIVTLVDAVVVAVVDTEVAEPVELRANADPGVDPVVI